LPWRPRGEPWNRSDVLVYSYSIDLESRLKELGSFLGDVGGSLRDLDYVRVLNNVPDDQDEDNA
jgi:hypothetical protein